MGKTCARKRCAPGRSAKAKNSVKTMAYIRTSTVTNKNRGGKARATRAIARVLKSGEADETIHEIISGAAPLAKRKQLVDLLSKKTHRGLRKVLVEGTRDIARNLVFAEQLYELSRAAGVRIECAGDPGLFDSSDSPAQKLTRRMEFLIDEYDSDNIRYKLQSGIRDKMASTRRKTQHGKPKVGGRKSILEKMGPIPAAKIAALKKYGQDRKHGKYGWRKLAEKIKVVLKLKTVPSHETARRMVNEAKVKRAR